MTDGDRGLSRPRPAAASLELDHDKRAVVCNGDWTVGGLQILDRRLSATPWPTDGQWRVDTSGVPRMDTAGALFVARILQALRAAGAAPALDGLEPRHRALLDLIADDPAPSNLPQPPKDGLLTALGRATMGHLGDAFAFLSFLGELALDSWPRFLRPHRLRWRQVVAELNRGGVTALPIVGLLSFLMGIVIAYQGGSPLQRYGGNVYLVDLLSITMLREMAPLLTAIIVAGRTGSSYAAHIGTMRVTEEIDALRALGMGPFEVLVLPKLLALIVALPLLSLFADVLGVFGGMLIANGMFSVSFPTFLARLPQSVSASTFWVGIGKAPVFAVLITTVGCFHGFQVRGSAGEVGRATTVSVVQSIFLVIIADAVFSILFNWLGL